MENDGGPAFPVAHLDDVVQTGMSMRDYFAAAALNGLLSSGEKEFIPNESGCLVNNKYIQDSAYRLADAMLAARRQK